MAMLMFTANLDVEVFLPEVLRFPGGNLEFPEGRFGKDLSGDAADIGECPQEDRQSP